MTKVEALMLFELKKLKILAAGRCDPLTQFECIGQEGKCIGTNYFFLCKKLLLIFFSNFEDKSFVCDGDNDCGNNYDEESCPPLVCPTGQFKCNLDNICINQTKRCDGVYDCPSFTDEQNCRFQPAVRSCRSNEFQCSSSGSSGYSNRVVCIPLSWKCDGHVDCQNGSDEPSTCPQTTCNSGYFRCNNTRCVPQSWVCGKLAFFSFCLILLKNSNSKITKMIVVIILMNYQTVQHNHFNVQIVKCDVLAL